jgi:hypothetical protein
MADSTHNMTTKTIRTLGLRAKKLARGKDDPKGLNPETDVKIWGKAIKE